MSQSQYNSSSRLGKENTMLRRKMAPGGKMIRATPSPMRRSSPHGGTMAGSPGVSLLKERAHEAVRMKDEQLKVLQQQNRKLLGTITDMEEEVADAKHKLAEVETAALRVQDENLQLRTSVQRAEEHGRLEAERHFQQEVEASQHQLRVMAEQNTELLRLLEAEEKRSTASRTELSEYKSRYKEAVNELSHVRGEMDEEITTLKETAKNSQQRERELLAEMESKDEQARGLRMNISNLEDKLVKVSTSNVELNSRLLDQQRETSEKEEYMQSGVDNALVDLQNTLAATSTELDIERREKGRLKSEVKEQADQLKEMAEKVFQLIDRLQSAESAKAPAEEAAVQVGKNLREAKERVLRLETERAEADKQARRFGEELRKARQKTQVNQQKLQEVTKMHRSEKELRLREARGRQEQQDARKALAGRVSYLMNKAALDDESRANARVDVKKLETQLHRSMKENEKMNAHLRRTKEANKVLTESMRIKADELEKMQVESQMRTWDQDKANKRLQADKASIKKKGVFGSRGGSSNGGGGAGGSDVSVDGKGTSLSRGSGYTIIKQLPRGREKAMPGLRAEKDDERAISLLKKLQINEFFRYVSRRPNERSLELCAEKVAQVLGTLRMSEAIAAARARRAENIMDRLRSELDMLRRKAQDQGDRLFSEEEAKRAALIKYLHTVIQQGVNSDSSDGSNIDMDRRQQKQNTSQRGDGGTGFLDFGDTSSHADSTVIEMTLPPVTVRLGSSGIGDEEIHALVAVLSSKDRADLLDLRGNSIGDVGARGLATLLRSSNVLAEVDVRDNCIGPTGVRILAEALEHNTRVRHVFVHGNGRIEALGSVSGGSDGNGGNGGGDQDEDDAVIDTVIVVNVANQRENKGAARMSTDGGGAPLLLAPLPKRSMLTPSKHHPRQNGGEEEKEDDTKQRPKFYTHRQEKERLDDIDAKSAAKRGKAQLETPLQMKIRDLERNLGPSANGPPENDAVAEINSIVEAEKWSGRAAKLAGERGLDNVPEEWMGTETAPAAYASPLTRRIRALEERLAIADMGEDGVVAPMPASEVVKGLTGGGGGSGGSELDDGSNTMTSSSSSRHSGVRRSGSRGTASRGDERNRKNGKVESNKRRPPLSGSLEGSLPRPRAKSALGRARPRSSPHGSGGGGSSGSMPSPAWQGNSGPSLLGNALAQKESINQDASRAANKERASANQQRTRPSTANSPIVGRSMSVRRAGAARVISEQKVAMESQKQQRDGKLARRK